jgi:hypothetical protein
MDRYFVSQKPEGGVQVIHINKPTDAETQQAVERTIFELSRSLLVNPTLSGDALRQWQLNIKPLDYGGVIPLTCQEISLDAIPIDRYFRDAWEWSD